MGGVVPREYVPGVEKGVAESLKQGFIAGCPMVHVRIALVDGKYHPVDSSSQAFETAAHIGMKEAVALAGPVLLEPIMTAVIEVPEANMGDVNSDLNTKRARILGMESTADGQQRITAQVPMAEMLHYATDLRSITQGRGTFSMELSRLRGGPCARSAGNHRGVQEGASREVAWYGRYMPGRCGHANARPAWYVILTADRLDVVRWRWHWSSAR